MFIYNVTIQIEWSIHELWVEWMKTEHIPDVMNTGCFTKFQFTRILDIDEETGPTYTTQYYAATMADYDTYMNKFATAMRGKVTANWGNKFTAFRTLMQVVH